MRPGQLATLLALAAAESASVHSERVVMDHSWLERPPASGPYVVEVARNWLDGCGRGCEVGYLEFTARHAGRGDSTDGKDLNRSITDIVAAAPPAPLGLDPATLRERIIDELHVGFLLDGLGRRSLYVTALRQSDEGDFFRRKLLFRDLEVGSFEATLLVPRGVGPRAAVLGLHGHRDNDRIFTRRYLGDELARRGFVVLVPRLRAHNCSPSENRIAHALLRRGFTLMGLHVYESLLMLEYLNSLEQVDSRRIGILGHSGGSSIANLVVRISDGFAAQVTDYATDFRNHCGPFDVHCETVPGLFRLSADINQRRSLSIPWRHVPYRYRDEEVRSDVLDFFETHLLNPPDVRPMARETLASSPGRPI